MLSIMQFCTLVLCVLWHLSVGVSTLAGAAAWGFIGLAGWVFADVVAQPYSAPVTMAENVRFLIVVLSVMK
jgi:hypothetical protein